MILVVLNKVSANNIDIWTIKVPSFKSYKSNKICKNLKRFNLQQD